MLARRVACLADVELLKLQLKACDNQIAIASQFVGQHATSAGAGQAGTSADKRAAPTAVPVAAAPAKPVASSLVVSTMRPASAAPTPATTTSGKPVDDDATTSDSSDSSGGSDSSSTSDDDTSDSSDSSSSDSSDDSSDDASDVEVVSLPAKRRAPSPTAPPAPTLAVATTAGTATAAAGAASVRSRVAVASPGTFVDPPVTTHLRGTGTVGDLSGVTDLLSIDESRFYKFMHARAPRSLEFCPTDPSLLVTRCVSASARAVVHAGWRSDVCGCVSAARWMARCGLGDSPRTDVCGR